MFIFSYLKRDKSTLSTFKNVSAFQKKYIKNHKSILVLCLFFLQHFSHATESGAVVTTLRTIIHSRSYLTSPFIDHYGIMRLSWGGSGINPIPHEEGAYFSAFSKEDNTLLASIQFFKFEPQENTFEMTIAIKKERWRQGIACEILKSLLPHVAEHHPLSQIIAQSNYRSEQEENENLKEKIHSLSPYWDDLSLGDFLTRSGMIIIRRNEVTGFDQYYYSQ